MLRRQLVVAAIIMFTVCARPNQWLTIHLKANSSCVLSSCPTCALFTLASKELGRNKKNFEAFLICYSGVTSLSQAAANNNARIEATRLLYC